MCKIVTESSRHMLALINDVLDFERLDTNQLKIENIPFDLHQEFTKLVRMLEPTARQKQIALTYRLAVDNCRRLGDPLRFGQILVNLAANALKFTPEGGSVNITVTTGCNGEADIVSRPRRQRKNPQKGPKPPPPRDLRADESAAVGSSSGGTGEEKKNEDGDSDNEDDSPYDDENLVTVVVQDSGIGIPEDHIPLLFKSFTQADISTTRKFGGSGLGLAICKRLCQLMHGRIGCHSRRDQGSTFWFTLPLPLAPEEKVRSPPARLDERTSTERELRGLRVLLVEDNKINQLIGKQMLARAGCGDVVVAPNGEQGVLAWEQQGPFHIVLMDYHMPVMDGLEATRRIRQREQELGLSTRTPIIAISASLEPKERARGATAGMDDWLEKPFNRRVLTATILRWARQAPT
jgi:CheY-like chemotaxis protein